MLDSSDILTVQRSAVQSEASGYCIMQPPRVFLTCLKLKQNGFILVQYRRPGQSQGIAPCILAFLQVLQPLLLKVGPPAIPYFLPAAFL